VIEQLFFCRGLLSPQRAWQNCSKWPTSLGVVSERRTKLSETDITLQFFSAVQAQGTNDHFQLRNLDDTMTAIGRERSKPCDVNRPTLCKNPKLRLRVGPTAGAG
jgi:hypothetical protein